ncbi:ergothioneine biosynthesis protein EgtB [Luteimonas sp. RD2P54]|uniref:Ergothioneine biosynthesis protein EgtB n=1 Tax=Luteimonas endophytica TaxID=3042023 RepID=A0ABT6J4T9_9GAMM|nr:ergothioneine biosynthesis protein EgtB [Luteimonas endophytica]MDH5821836.1 ergothioneine biosynthesis protein EgtB [Luteimonas endophytica]
MSTMAAAVPDLAPEPPPGSLAERFRRVRAHSAHLAAPLSAEDAMVQSMPDASPAKWHLAHTTWFFERFILAARPGYRPFDPDWDYLFNSYYQSVGPFHARPNRGMLSRPSLAQVREYRAEVEMRLLQRLDAGDLDGEALQRLELGLHHEQQHQELLLTDIKHALWCNPLQPAYRADLVGSEQAAAPPLRWLARDECIATIGAPAWPAADAFAYDNESPPHRVLVPAHALASRPVSNAEFRGFIDDGGYREPGLWLSDGWARLQAGSWQRPLYWHEDLERAFTLGGVRALDPQAPVAHLSYYEADAYARWAGARLPTEAEWELAAAPLPVAGHFAGDDRFEPRAAGPVGDAATPVQLFGDVWEWTSSAYTAYPGFRAWRGSLGEYNGKFMCGQWVLRGGSCATPRDHVRASYRNFFPPDARWQFAGLRLARDA